jgi:hypothetical protein
LFGHIGDENLKNRGKKYIGLQWGTKLNLTTNLVLNYVCLVLSFLECFQPMWFFSTKEPDVVRVKFWLHDTQAYLYNVNNEIIATCTLQKDLCILGQSQY